MTSKLDDYAMISTRMHAVAGADTDDFKDLLMLADLDPSKDLRFQDWSDISFENEDLKGLDFSGARLLRCNFKGARLVGSRFDSAIIDWVGQNPLLKTSFAQAPDWQEFCQTWTRPLDPVEDISLRPGMVFQDAPFATRMVVIAPGAYVRRTSCTTETLVTLENPFAVSQFRVTAEELRYRALRIQRIRDASRDQPLSYWSMSQRWSISDRITWDGAIGYVQWLSSETGHRYRLLSESEWEYCAHIPTQPLPRFGRFGRILRSELEPGLGLQNDFGLYQVGTGMWEWCNDIWCPNRDGAPINGASTLSGNNDRRTVRRGVSDASGVSSHVSSREVRAHRRLSTKHTARFRIARDLEI